MTARIDGKPVVSRLLPQEGYPRLFNGTKVRAVYLAFSTRFDGKTVYTGVGIGFFDDHGRPCLTTVAGEVLKVISEYRTGRIFICLCNNLATARKRAVEALNLAADGDGLFILCSDSNVCDAVHITETFGLEEMT
jgi:hypothetical protein